MEALKDWGLMILFISAGSLIYCFLLPSGTVSRTTKNILSIVMISAVFMPLFSVFSDSDGFFAESDTPPQTESFDSYVEQGAREAVEAVIGDTVKKFTNVPYKTEIFINIDDTMSINIEYVGMTFSAQPQHEKELRQALSEALGIVPDIRVELLNE